jgi:hypothetical protein
MKTMPENQYQINRSAGSASSASSARKSDLQDLQDLQDLYLPDSENKICIT